MIILSQDHVIYTYRTRQSQKHSTSKHESVQRFGLTMTKTTLSKVWVKNTKASSLGNVYAYKRCPYNRRTHNGYDRRMHAKSVVLQLGVQYTYTANRNVDFPPFTGLRSKRGFLKTFIVCCN